MAVSHWHRCIRWCRYSFNDPPVLIAWFPSCFQETCHYRVMKSWSCCVFSGNLSLPSHEKLKLLCVFRKPVTVESWKAEAAVCFQETCHYRVMKSWSCCVFSGNLSLWSYEKLKLLCVFRKPVTTESWKAEAAVCFQEACHCRVMKSWSCCVFSGNLSLWSHEKLKLLCVFRKPVTTESWKAEAAVCFQETCHYRVMKSWSCCVFSGNLSLPSHEKLKLLCVFRKPVTIESWKAEAAVCFQETCHYRVMKSWSCCVFSGNLSLWSHEKLKLLCVFRKSVTTESWKAEAAVCFQETCHYRVMKSWSCCVFSGNLSLPSHEKLKLLCVFRKPVTIESWKAEAAVCFQETCHYRVMKSWSCCVFSGSLSLWSHEKLKLLCVFRKPVTAESWKAEAAVCFQETCHCGVMKSWSCCVFSGNLSLPSHEKLKLLCVFRKPVTIESWKAEAAVCFQETCHYRVMKSWSCCVFSGNLSLWSHEKLKLLCVFRKPVTTESWKAEAAVCFQETCHCGVMKSWSCCVFSGNLSLPSHEKLKLLCVFRKPVTTESWKAEAAVCFQEICHYRVMKSWSCCVFSGNLSLWSHEKLKLLCVFRKPVTIESWKAEAAVCFQETCHYGVMKSWSCCVFSGNLSLPSHEKLKLLCIFRKPVTTESWKAEAAVCFQETCHCGVMKSWSCCVFSGNLSLPSHEKLKLLCVFRKPVTTESWKAEAAVCFQETCHCGVMKSWSCCVFSGNLSLPSHEKLKLLCVFRKPVTTESWKAEAAVCFQETCHCGVMKSWSCCVFSGNLSLSSHEKLKLLCVFRKPVTIESWKAEAAVCFQVWGALFELSGSWNQLHTV